MISEKRATGFQSTRPVWGATYASGSVRNIYLISIHAPRMGRDKVYYCHPYSAYISIHAPRMGRDGVGFTDNMGGVISIHAPRMGRDGAHSEFADDHSYFNPRAPYGARRTLGVHAATASYFNPRAPYGARHRT